MQISNVAIIKESSREIAIELAIKEMYRDIHAQEYIDKGTYADGVLTFIRVTQWHTDSDKTSTSTTYFIASKINNEFTRVEQCYE